MQKDKSFVVIDIETTGLNNNPNVGEVNHIIEVGGHKDAIGKPALFGTTDEFLKRFELSTLDDLPDYDSIIGKIRAQEIGTSADNSYLYCKDEYISEIPEEEEELEEISFDEEDIPDFIKDDEDAVQIG